jgi:hypothetical protein
MPQHGDSPEVTVVKETATPGDLRLLLESPTKDRAPDCDCGLIECVCAEARMHDESCRFRIALTCAVPIACEEHETGDICPICDACTCKKSEKDLGRGPAVQLNLLRAIGSLLVARDHIDFVLGFVREYDVEDNPFEDNVCPECGWSRRYDGILLVGLHHHDGCKLEAAIVALRALLGQDKFGQKPRCR